MQSYFREVRTLRGHIANVGSVVFNPSNKSLGDDPRANALASCAQVCDLVVNIA